MLYNSVDNQLLRNDLIRMYETKVKTYLSKHCDYIMRAPGDNILSGIDKNDLIGLSNVDQWNDFILYGEVYAILTTDNQLMINKIMQSENDDYLTLLSEPHKQIKKSSISKIYTVKTSNSIF